MKTFIFLVTVSLAFAIARGLVPPQGVSVDDIYKDMAHIWIGGLMGIWATLWFLRPICPDLRRIVFWMIVLLIVVELFFALGHRFFF